MKKPKFSLGQGGLQGLFLQHVEKIVLFVVLLIVALYLYSGYSLEGYKQEKTPVDLKFTTISARDHLEKNTSDILALEAERKPVTDYQERADEGRMRTAARNYPIGAINIPSFPPRFKRSDPKIYTPESVIARGFLASVYMQSPGETDPFRNDGDVAPAKPKQSQNGKSGKGKDEPGAFPGMGGPSGGPGSRPPGGKSGDKNKDKDKGAFGPGNAFPGAAGGEEGAFGGGAPGQGMQGGGGSVSEAYRKKYIEWTPRSGGANMNSAQSKDSVAAAGKTQYIVSIVATFPYEKQFEEYQRVFADAEGYEPSRDTPRFERVIVERSEVSADPKAEPEWTRVIISKRFVSSWVEPTMPEVADAQYTDPILTIPMPPAVMIDPVKLGSHPQIPRAAAIPDNEADKTAKRPVEDEGEPDEEDSLGFRRRSGADRQGDGMGPAMDGMGGPKGGGGMAGPRGSRAPAGRDGGAGGPGMQGMAGMSGKGAGSPALGAKPTSHKLIRFFDFYAQPGKVYRYRVKVLLEDPNNPWPKGEFDPPEPRTLDNAVTVRINEQKVKDPEMDTLRESGWSEVSAPVSLPPPTNFVVGSVSISKPMLISGIPIYTDDPSAVMLAVVWDQSRAINVPGRPVYSEDERDIDKPAIFRGTILNFKRKATKVLRPDTLEMKSIKDYSFITNALVLDLRPSEPLPLPKSSARTGRDKPTPLTTAGEILLVDNEGRFIVRDDLDDTDYFRMYTFADEETKPSSGSGGAGGGAIPGMGAGDGPAGGLPGGGAIPGVGAGGGKKPGRSK